MRLLRRTTPGFVSNNRASVAVEFALVGGMLFFTILFVLLVSVILFLGQSIDYATQKAARQVMTGAVQAANLNQSDFRTKILCPLLPVSINCSNVIVNLYSVQPGTQSNWYYTFTNGGNASGLLIPPLTNSSAQYSLGIQGNYQYLLVVYPITFLPSFLSSRLGTVTFNGQPAFPIVAGAAFRNEQY